MATPELPATERALHTARAAVLRDLEATGRCDPSTVSLVDHAVAHRRWWVEQWPEGASFLTGLMAQDVADALLETVGRWPCCLVHDEEPLVVEPALGEDPRWVCGRCGTITAVGALADPS
ncbi:MAG: hypothetical protein GEV07_22830 [Streptosporangiales bacterium]|nr:hypothetical protein [Streptosporangiales bacterium]